jgi:outer membrane protein OmpA-like peptidoglycan-associated protein
MTKTLLRVAAVMWIAAALGACSVMPDWLGGDSDTPSSSDTADTAAPPADQSTQTADSTATSNGQFPDLADTPNRPAAPSTADDQKKVADSLAADRARQNYSADALRAGSEPAAAPPGAAPPPDETVEADAGSKSGSSSGGDADNTSDGDSGASDSSAAAPTPAPPPSTPAPAPTTAVASNPAPAPSGGLPAVPASTIPGAQSVAMSDAALGFQASKAPPLDASVAQFVPMPIMSRYQQTASMGGAPGLSGSPYAGGPAVPAVPNSRRAVAMGGPEQMSGAVVANYDALPGGSAVPAIAYANAQGLPPAAVVIFPSATTILSADAKAQVQSAAQSFNARGATGYIRVVGHAAIASAKISEERRLQINFERSQARATAVMRELIKDGVPANKILIDAVGDSQPVYDASAQGESGNRRAEIFFQG